MSSSIEIVVGARSSRLSQIQVAEVTCHFPHIKFILKSVETTGDKDQITSLKSLGKDDFFTKEIDQMLLAGDCRIAIHSAKDLPEPLPKGLVLIALTEGLDASDSLVFNEELPNGATIGTSCERRENQVKAFRSDLNCVDIRGTIEKRLSLLDENKVQGVVIAEAALLRLGFHKRKRVRLRGQTAPFQGKLAILARENDQEMAELFSYLDVRKKRVLYLGLDPSHYQSGGIVTHYPVIKVLPRTIDLEDIKAFTHLIFTSKSAVHFFFQKFSDISGKIVIAIGEVTALHLDQKGIIPDYVAEEETQEGVIVLLEKLDLTHAHFLLPRSSLSRPLLVEFLQKKNVKYLALDLYDTIPCRHFPLPDFKQFDEIVFTSPSTVDAFLKIFPTIPDVKKITAIGPVTSNALATMIPKKAEKTL